jgi:hypothetical protein
MDVYSHIIEGMQSQAMALLDEVLPEGKNGVAGGNNADLTQPEDIIPVEARILALGGVTERLMVAVLKTAFVLWRTWVRIPPPPRIGLLGRERRRREDS